MTVVTVRQKFGISEAVTASNASIQIAKSVYVTHMDSWCGRTHVRAAELLRRLLIAAGAKISQVK